MVRARCQEHQELRLIPDGPCIEEFDSIIVGAIQLRVFSEVCGVGVVPKPWKFCPRWESHLPMATPEDKGAWGEDRGVLSIPVPLGGNEKWETLPSQLRALGGAAQDVSPCSESEMSLHTSVLSCSSFPLQSSVLAARQELQVPRSTFCAEINVIIAVVNQAFTRPPIKRCNVMKFTGLLSGRFPIPSAGLGSQASHACPRHSHT